MSEAEARIIHPKGFVFHGPDGMGYALTRDVRVGDFILAIDFQSINGAPEPVTGDVLPKWLADQIIIVYGSRPPE